VSENFRLSYGLEHFIIGAGGKMNDPDIGKIKRATLRPSPTSSIITLIMSLLFLVFGLVFFFSVIGETGEGRGLISFFFLIWVAACLGMAVYSIVNLSSFKKSSPNPAALEVLEIEKENAPAKKEEAAGAKPDFSVRLREIEALRKEGLLTEEEYQRKRKEILDEKW